jgi:hypothetical protein
MLFPYPIKLDSSEQSTNHIYDFINY